MDEDRADGEAMLLIEVRGVDSALEVGDAPPPEDRRQRPVRKSQSRRSDLQETRNKPSELRDQKPAAIWSITDTAPRSVGFRTTTSCLSFLSLPPPSFFCGDKLRERLLLRDRVAGAWSASMRD